eukprot:gnl/TRDRNA2_/TRDRNA2_136201_c0_seq1.p1 gnl/TRDRNA2_/TRDRNA2_136201_c0~~gnl/TRDRNA2_/TRDRNA2_136201_c0_seq1.p1  ORF type:complete len:311 (+),score=68.64 gnl/TRDRNA2_/TRDRNA2_136201_c0_seq1:33-935(+)
MPGAPGGGSYLPPTAPPGNASPMPGGPYPPQSMLPSPLASQPPYSAGFNSYAQPPGPGQGPYAGGAGYSAGLAFSEGSGRPGAAAAGPSGGGGSFNGLGNLGTWNELIAGGVVDKHYIEQEAERRKQEIDRALDIQLAQLESSHQEQKNSVQQQAEYHTQMAERQIESHKRQHIAHITRQAEMQALAILQRAEMEKGRLGQEACRALSAQSEKEKATVLHEAMRKAEDVWRQSQRTLLEQAQKAKSEIDTQAQRRTADIEREARQAVSRIYISPMSPNAPVGAPAFSSSQSYDSFVPAPA